MSPEPSDGDATGAALGSFLGGGELTMTARAFTALVTFWCYGPMRRATQDRWGN